MTAMARTDFSFTLEDLPETLPDGGISTLWLTVEWTSEAGFGLFLTGDDGFQPFVSLTAEQARELHAALGEMLHIASAKDAR